MFNISFRSHPGLSALCCMFMQVYQRSILVFYGTETKRHNILSCTLVTGLSSLHKNKSLQNCTAKVKKCFIAWLTGTICNLHVPTQHCKISMEGLRALHTTISKWILKILLYCPKCSNPSRGLLVLLLLLGHQK